MSLCERYLYDGRPGADQGTRRTRCRLSRFSCALSCIRKAMALNERPQNPTPKGHLTSVQIGATEAFRTPVSALPLAPGQAWIEERTRVAVSRNINVSGKLVFQEPVRVEGHLRGEVSSGDLVVICEGAAVDGRVKT